MNISRFSQLIFFICALSIIASCSSKPNGGGRGFSRNEDIDDEGSGYTEEVSEEESDFTSGCVVEDGTYSATVDYYNPETGYSQTYSLDVEVESCEVVQIDFPNGGWLDSDHISPAELDDNARCTVDGEEGRSYDIQIDGY
jgi:hypothetical protein